MKWVWLVTAGQYPGGENLKMATFEARHARRISEGSAG